MSQKSLATVTVGDLRDNTSAVLDQVRHATQPTMVLDTKEPAVVMLSLEAFEKAEHDTRLLRRLAQGEAEIAAGEGYSLASVMDDADKILHRKKL